MTGSTVIPCLRYRDAKRMIGWLCDASGFRPQAVYEDGSDGIAHAQLTLGSGMIMLGSLRENDQFAQVQSIPATLGGTTQSPYLVVADADAIYRSAIAAGAEIVIEIKDEDYGGRGFPVATRKATSGTSARTIPGSNELRRRGSSLAAGRWLKAGPHRPSAAPDWISSAPCRLRVRSNVSDIDVACRPQC